MSSRHDILMTGTPRSGTTLSCHLLNKLPEAVALHEPMRVRTFAAMEDHAAVARAIREFCDDQRRSILEQKRAISKQAGGRVPDNPFGVTRSGVGLRQRVVAKGRIVIDKPLSPQFALVVKHISAFTAVLGEIVKHFPVYAVVRNPLANLASWNSIDFALQGGRVPAAERLDERLKVRLDALGDPLDRQILLLDWFHRQYLQHLPESSILRYESIVETRGKTLAIVLPQASALDEPLVSRNTNQLYDRAKVERMGQRLLASDGTYWETYSRDSVERLLDEMLAGDAAAGS
jgi:hypothetical protein